MGMELETRNQVRHFEVISKHHRLNPVGKLTISHAGKALQESFAKKEGMGTYHETRT
jgi:hypothetical protein